MKLENAISDVSSQASCNFKSGHFGYSSFHSLDVGRSTVGMVSAMVFPIVLTFRKQLFHRSVDTWHVRFSMPVTGVLQAKLCLFACCLDTEADTILKKSFVP